MTLTDTYGGTTVVAELDCITDTIATPTSMYSASAGIQKVLCGIEHDVESPSGRYAVPLAQGWLRSGEPHSVTGIVDGFSIVQCLPFGAWTWGAGGAVNPCSVQWEQAGYVTFTEKMWLGTETVGTTYVDAQGNSHAWTAVNNQQMAAQFVNYATMVAQTNHHFGWGAPRYGTQDEFNQMLEGVEVGVWFAHNDVSNWDPQHRTTHTDHAPNYPRNQHMALAAQIYDGSKPTPPAVIPPVVIPPVTPIPLKEDWMDGKTLFWLVYGPPLHKGGPTPIYLASVLGRTYEHLTPQSLNDVPVVLARSGFDAPKRWPGVVQNLAAFGRAI